MIDAKKLVETVESVLRENYLPALEDSVAERAGIELAKVLHSPAFDAWMAQRIEEFVSQAIARHIGRSFAVMISEMTP